MYSNSNSLYLSLIPLSKIYQYTKLGRVKSLFVGVKVGGAISAISLHTLSCLLMRSQRPEIQEKGRKSGKPAYESHSCSWHKPLAMVDVTFVKIVAYKHCDASRCTCSRICKRRCNLHQKINSLVLSCCSIRNICIICLLSYYVGGKTAVGGQHLKSQMDWMW